MGISEEKQKKLAYVARRYYLDDWKQSDIAKELGVSKYHLSHVFSARLHTSFREYVNALRLDCARDLLAATELSMLEVSMESGFDSLRTFNRVFQERFRQTPSQYRKSRTGALWGAQDGQRRKGA